MTRSLPLRAEADSVGRAVIADWMSASRGLRVEGDEGAEGSEEGDEVERERSWRVSISVKSGCEREEGVSRICRRSVFADVPGVVQRGAIRSSKPIRIEREKRS